MIERLLFLLVAYPAILRFSGRLLATAAFASLALGWRAHHVLSVLEFQLRRTGVEGPHSLSALYPSVPTWWIPESAEGYALYVALVGTGFAMSFFAKRVERHWH
jgi:hypothetical protein